MDVRRQLQRSIDEILCDDPRAALIAYRRFANDELPWLEQRVVLLARRCGWDWGRIGRLLGRRRQSVRERFVHLSPRLMPDPEAGAKRQEREIRAVIAAALPTRATNASTWSDDDDPVAW